MSTQVGTSLTASAEAISRVVRGVADQLGQPMTAVQIQAHITDANDLSLDEMLNILDGMCESGRLFRFVTHRSMPNFYCNQDRDSYIRDGIVATLEEQPMSRVELESALKRDLVGVSANACRLMTRKLIKDGVIRELPPMLGRRAKRLSVNDLCVDHYTDHVIDQLAHQLERHGVSRDRIIASFARHQDGGSIAAMNEDEAAELVLEAIRACGNSGGLGGLMSILELRRATQASIAEHSLFSNAVIALARRGFIALHRHDYPAGLEEAARNQLVTDGMGNYFVGVALRK